MLIRPNITEKAMRLAQLGQFTFIVSPQTSKTQVKELVEKTFSVNVLKVRKINKTKVVVALKPGQMIEYFELPEKKSEKKIKK